MAWNPPSHTFVCSAIDELKNHPFPSSLRSSLNMAGLQLLWQNASFTECLQLKWSTSTVRPISLKKGLSLTCFASEQLLSKKRWFGACPLIRKVRLIKSLRKMSLCELEGANKTYCTRRDGLCSIKSLPSENHATRSYKNLFVMGSLSPKPCRNPFLAHGAQRRGSAWI